MLSFRASASDEEPFNHPARKTPRLRSGRQTHVVVPSERQRRGTFHATVPERSLGCARRDSPGLSFRASASDEEPFNHPARKAPRLRSGRQPRFVVPSERQRRGTFQPPCPKGPSAPIGATVPVCRSERASASGGTFHATVPERPLGSDRGDRNKKNPPRFPGAGQVGMRTTYLDDRNSATARASSSVMCAVFSCIVSLSRSRPRNSSIWVTR